MEAPFEVNTWDGVTGAIYTGYGSGEMLWLLVMLALIVVALFLGWRHEEHAYKATKSQG
ncbi:hypothetical protein Q8W37_00270 [Shimia thalassica]|uniref:Uncharacterized protein n=1 Tax=Shimia thalassica TaxID=1715693 RepID=A0A0P1IC54_9RHOB|nr:hypothetical protein [Shimia thalassica]MBU2944715.1 hypothetical protein [Shimia thalassica]MDO6479294.1 hypothetical protein [Shimia thalassica]MDO6482322.1 hypothetical protein [Shimia thalassica]MDO6501939.1 hypothetical protein [Shimia thalassica]MDO6520334.1 hypothetical protein [Shimia thalassica]